MAAFEDGIVDLKVSSGAMAGRVGSIGSTAPPACGELPKRGAEVESHDA